MFYDYSALKTELVTDPAALGYAGMTDAQAAVAMSNANITISVDVSARDVRGFLYATGKWNGIVSLSLDAKSGNTVHDNALVAAKQIVEFANQNETFSTSIGAVGTQVQSDLGSLVSVGVLTSNDVTSVLLLSVGKISRAKQIGWGTGLVNVGDVGRSRSM